MEQDVTDLVFVIRKRQKKINAHCPQRLGHWIRAHRFHQLLCI